MLSFSYTVMFFPVEVQLYSPERTLVDTGEVFLWLMAVGTILCASYWSAWTAREASLELEKLLKVFYIVIHLNSIISSFSILIKDGPLIQWKFFVSWFIY